MKEVFIGSGKGGVGKSMLTASLAIFASQGKKVLALDADADAPNLALWLGGINTWDKKERISTSQKPEINPQKCTNCGLCAKKCSFGALKMKKKKIKFIPFVCEGCGLCKEICPQGAIKMKSVENGYLVSKNKASKNLDLISCQLFPGETGSGKIIDKMKEESQNWRKNKDIIFVDSAPGTGCPVNAALRGADLAILITEPTPSGVSDLKNLIAVVKHFKIPWFLVVNKLGLNSATEKKLKKFAGNNYLGGISYDQKIFKAITKLKPIPHTNLKAKQEIYLIWKKLKNILKNIDNKQKLI